MDVLDEGFGSFHQPLDHKISLKGLNVLGVLVLMIKPVHVCSFQVNLDVSG